jgi:tight adherence protein B
MISPSLLLEILGAIGVFAAVASIGMSRTKSREEELDERVRHFAQAGAGMMIDYSQQEAEAPKSLKERLLSFRTRQVTPTKIGRRTERENKTAEALAKADLKLRVQEWYIIRLGAIGVLALIGVAVYRSVIFAAVLAVVGLFLPRFVLRFRQKRRSRKFNNQLSDVLVLLSNGVKAGYSFPQAMASISKSAEPPVSEEFARANREIQLGVNVDDALQHMVKRVDSEDLDLVITAVQIQRVVGGNLAEILDSIAFTIRERVRIKGEIRTLTAQARASSYIITGLPIALGLVLEAINPTYIAPLLSFKGPGPFILMGCGVSIGVAYFVMQKIANIEV